ncbi:peptide/nickel transport system permease protein [Devosia sp. YR412]|uniref:ABC transporter permease n=1 Tax=Devosia sp. YR412 TaxID=1881030 RepID=UPI0008C05A20|nr:ABC transporter permease [Devosia sp. YR412]SEQ62621.1 peptide/nickel transport system permease protein [Devosia sp. YR412]
MSEAIDIPAVMLRSTGLNNRAWTLLAALTGALVIASVAMAAVLLGGFGIDADFTTRLAPPSLSRWFGTDQLGHDMLARTIHGLNVSLWVGLIAATISVLIATLLALFATTCGRWADALVSFLIDAAMGLPHLVLLILISFALGGGTAAVIIAVAVTHWPRLTRILRAEILQLRHADFIIVSRRMGKSWAYIGYHHFLPHLWPQLLVGLVLLFPHAILHEAALTFIGFGLEPSKPAIGVLLSDSMRYLMAGKWWLGLFPGLCLLMLVLCFDAIGNGLRLLADPRQEQL